MKILIVDDDIELVATMTTFLENEKHEVISAHTPDDGVSAFVKYNPEVVFLDLFYVGHTKTGSDVLVEMKSINKNVPVAIITGYNDAERVMCLIKQGALDCIFKPFNFDYIKSLLIQIQQNRRKTIAD